MGDESGCSRVLVTGIAPVTTEETLRDFFAFCGEISMMHLYTSSGNKDSSRSKEAVVKFTTEAAATTACLLNNAVIDGNNVSVELFPMADEQTSSSSSQAASSKASKSAEGRNDSGSSFSSMLGTLSASSLAFASSVASKVKEVDSKYSVSSRVKSGASTAWEGSKKIASDIDTKYKVKENVSSAMKSTKSHVSAMAKSVNESIKSSSSRSGGSGGSASAPSAE